MFNLVVKYSVLASAVVFFVTMIAMSARFFVVPDGGAVLGKIVLGVLVLALTPYVVLGIERSQFSLGLFVVALFLYCYSIGVMIWARKSNSVPLDFIGSQRQPEHFNQSGVYGYIRHPFYSAYIAGWMAGSVASKDLIVVVIAFVMMVIYVSAAIQEERRFLGGRFGEDYLEYKKRTGMLSPRILGSQDGRDQF